jgi:hypothetical protein
MNMQGNPRPEDALQSKNKAHTEVLEVCQLLP